MYGSELDADHPVSVTQNCSVEDLFGLFASQIKSLLTADCFQKIRTGFSLVASVN